MSFVMLVRTNMYVLYIHTLRIRLSTLCILCMMCMLYVHVYILCLFSFSMVSFHSSIAFRNAGSCLHCTYTDGTCTYMHSAHTFIADNNITYVGAQQQRECSMPQPRLLSAHHPLASPRNQHIQI